MRRPLFLRWLLVNALALAFLIGLGAAYGHLLTGTALVVVPVIFVTGVAGSAYAGLIAWRRDLHGIENVSYTAYVCQVMGILATVFGFWILLAANGDASALGDRIQNGGGVALVGTFMGVFWSLVLTLEERLIRHELS